VKVHIRIVPEVPKLVCKTLSTGSQIRPGIKEWAGLAGSTCRMHIA
jgi:hypothetical protein